MSKRGRGILHDEHPAKRLRLSAVDWFSALSDELILRTFSYLTISDLVICHRWEHAYMAKCNDLSKDTDYRDAWMLSQVTPNYGNPHITTASSDPERCEYLDFAVMI